MIEHALAPHVPQSAVPQGYAEKAMASLMQLHSELMDEKERRVELYRRLMDKEQALAELKNQVKALEDKLAAQLTPTSVGDPSTSSGRTEARATPPARSMPQPVPTAPMPVEAAPSPPPYRAPPPPMRVVPPQRTVAAAAAGFRSAMARAVPDGWKTW